MAVEWTNKYNPFNSWKALTHTDRFQAILDGEPKSPVVVNMDLTNKCNYDCGFCMFKNSARADETSRNFRNNESLEKGYALTLPKLWKDWGVKSVCLAGGGEPTLHSDCKDFIKECNNQGLELGFVTNGYLVNNKDWYQTVAANCKFVGFSIDAGNPKDYAKVKGVPEHYFGQVITNMKNIASVKRDLETDVQIGFKFLLDKNNQNSIYDAAKLARTLGANHFQFRPAIDDYKYSEQEIENIWKQIEEAQKLETDDFQVFGVKHKFNQDLTKKHNFNKCRANMLTTTWAADGKVYMCTDSRGNPWSELGEHYPNPEEFIKLWGSREHFDKVDKINHNKNCDRCTLTAYNEFFENIFLEDKMDRNLI